MIRRRWGSIREREDTLLNDFADLVSYSSNSIEFHIFGNIAEGKHSRVLKRTLSSLHYFVLDTVYTLQSTVYSLQSTVYTLQCTVYSLQTTVYSLQSTVYSLQSTVYMSTVYMSTVYMSTCLQSTVYSLQFTDWFPCDPKITWFDFLQVMMRIQKLFLVLPINNRPWAT